jgi:hypothetical protein
VTEAEWLACEDPVPMLSFLKGRVSERKLRLFTCACCRRVWDLLAGDELRAGVEAAERYADGRATPAELDEARSRASDVYWQGLQPWPAEPAEALERFRLVRLRMRSHIAVAAAMPSDRLDYYGRGYGSAREAASLAPDEEAARSKLVRDVFGNPFRPTPAVDPAWLAWNDSTVRRLAEAVYEERAFDRLPVLADALNDAGCSDAALLGHLRSGSEHVRGCWAVDLLLGKE